MSWKWITALVLLLVAGCSPSGEIARIEQVPRISKEDLKDRLGSPDLILLDVRQQDDWSASNHKIVGAIREEPKAFFNWREKYPRDKTIVLYCA